MFVGAWTLQQGLCIFTFLSKSDIIKNYWTLSDCAEWCCNPPLCSSYVLFTHTCRQLNVILSEFVIVTESIHITWTHLHLGTLFIFLLKLLFILQKKSFHWSNHCSCSTSHLACFIAAGFSKEFYGSVCKFEKLFGRQTTLRLCCDWFPNYQTPWAAV